MNSKLKPAIVGGVVVGLLSAIPFVNIANVCCCLWALLGGALASYLYIKNSATPARAGDGAILGVLAGVVGAAIYIVLGIPLAIVTGSAINQAVVKIIESADPAQAEALSRQLEANQSVLSAVLFGFLSAIFLVIFSTVGGLLGVPIFERRKGTANIPPPPPQGFGGGQPGGGYGSGM
jgi:hypothetical protein